MKEFKDLIHPINLDTFTKEYWCRRAFFLKGHKDKYKTLFNWNKLNEILNSNIAPHPSVFIAKAGSRETPKTYQDLVSALQKGATMVIEDADRFDSILSEFLNHISYEFIHNTRFNLYLSYPGKAGYLTHYDTHDVFILQIKGAKKWRVFNSTIENPIFFQKIHGITKPSDDNIYIDETLNEGDFLYIPRGHWHDAIATDDLSLHLTLAIFPRTGIFFMNWLTDELTENTKFRHNFPLIFPDNREEYILPAFQKHIDILKAELIQLIEQTDLTDKFYDFIVSATKDRPRVGLPYLTHFNTNDNIESLIFRRPTKIHRVKKLISKTIIINGNKRISLSPNCNSLIDFIYSRDNFDFKELQVQTNIDKEDLIKIVRLLISEGIIIASGEQHYS